jgi:hypothetical protein
MKKGLFVILCLILFTNSLFAQFVSCDTSYKVPYSPLLQKINGLKGYYGSVKLNILNRILPLSNCSLSANAEEVFKNGDQIYIFLAQTGFIYKMSEPQDSMVVFSKIDHTYNLNYNIDCYNFSYKGNIYNYGGYGFWQKTGHLRRYNGVDKEWDIVPTNIEVIPGGYEWYSKNEGKMYVPFQKIEKRFLKDPIYKTGEYDFKSYVLDINKADWKHVGNVSNDLKKLILQQDNYLCLKIDSGNLFLINDEAYYLNYINNKVYKSKQADINQFLLRNSQNTPIFYHQGIIYIYNVTGKTFKTWNLDLNNFSELNFTIWTFDYTTYYFVIALVMLLALCIVSYMTIKRKIKSRLQNAQLKMLKTDSINQAFAGVELNLIELLLEEHKKGNKVEIHQMNHVLGIKDKNIGLQKKVRSDVINSINDKYQFITQANILLISSVRKVDDKRFFEYFITDTEINNIQRIIKSN